MTSTLDVFQSSTRDTAGKGIQMLRSSELSRLWLEGIEDRSRTANYVGFEGIFFESTQEVGIGGIIESVSYSY